jgi:hypothetical protein
VALVIVSPLPGSAQTRADEIAKQQGEKAQLATTYRPNRVEVFLDQVEQGKWMRAPFCR